jgi:D-alanine-D-alanine ligase
MSARRKVAVLFGGRSLEHDVSVASGLQILQAIDPGRFEPLPVYIDQHVRWWTGDDLWHNESFKSGGPDRSRLMEVVLSSGYGTSSLMPGAASYNRKNIPIDVFVPVLHGTYGEDGCIQGQLELSGCAYVGCGVLASSVGMNKRVTKIMASHAGVPIVPWVSYQRSALDRGKEWLRELPDKIESSFGWPVIVKPCNLGLSAGVSVARSQDELLAGVFRVFECDTEALIEPFIKNRLEVNVAVAGLDEPVASITEMPITNQTSPLNFSEKYKRQGGKLVSSMEGMAGALRILDPPDLPGAMRSLAQKYATTVFSVLGCEGISRIDFLINADTNELFFNEINTLPGSLAYYLWSAAPHYWTITELLTRLISRAEKIRAAKMSLLRQPPPELRLF